MSDFKIGDFVLILEEPFKASDNIYAGKIGEITCIDTMQRIFKVSVCKKGELDIGWWYDENQLMALSAKQATFIKKLTLDL